jgi:hypothetical protein
VESVVGGLVVSLLLVISETTQQAMVDNSPAMLHHTWSVLAEAVSDWLEGKKVRGTSFTRRTQISAVEFRGSGSVAMYIALWSETIWSIHLGHSWADVGFGKVIVSDRRGFWSNWR